MAWMRLDADQFLPSARAGTGTVRLVIGAWIAPMPSLLVQCSDLWGCSPRAHSCLSIETSCSSIETVLLGESTPRFVANREAASDEWKRGKMERILMLLNAAIAASTRVGLSMNVPRGVLDTVLGLLPESSPTISPLSDDGWVDVFVIIDEEKVRDLVPRLSDAGARVIVETPLNKIID